MKYNEKIRNLREDADLTQTELAKLLNTNQRKISRIENADTEPNIHDLIMICKTFNISCDYLLGLPKGLKYP